MEERGTERFSRTTANGVSGKRASAHNPATTVATTTRRFSESHLGSKIYQ